MFKRTPEADINGTSLQVYLDEVTTPQIRRIFGKPDLDAYHEPEKGYDGDEYKFTDEIGNVVNLYARYGAWRIGAHNRAPAELFATWLRAYPEG